MHELSIATALIEQLEDLAKENQFNSIDEVEIETGYLRQVVPDLMQVAFQEASRGKITEGATLRIVEVKAEVRCQKCDHTFEPELDNFLCPKCEEADVEILKGNDIILKSVSSPTS